MLVFVFQGNDLHHDVLNKNVIGQARHRIRDGTDFNQFQAAVLTGLNEALVNSLLFGIEVSARFSRTGHEGRLFRKKDSGT